LNHKGFLVPIARFKRIFFTRIIIYYKNSYENNKRVLIYGADEYKIKFTHISVLAISFISLCKKKLINCEGNISIGLEIKITNLLKQI
tara:strand:- start:1184 stop:1447 length:264 start_codon:yes stop_codon:yes gene_type:complete